jgi:hypothetical protein
VSDLFMENIDIDGKKAKLISVYKGREQAELGARWYRNKYGGQTEVRIGNRDGETVYKVYATGYYKKNME